MTIVTVSARDDWLAGIELDLGKAWVHRRERGVTAVLALGIPLVRGGLVAAGMTLQAGWMGERAAPWQSVLGVGMAGPVTALPILLMEKLAIRRGPLGQRILRNASLDDVAIWGVLALVLMDWERVGKQLAVFPVCRPRR